MIKKLKLALSMLFVLLSTLAISQAPVKVEVETDNASNKTFVTYIPQAENNLIENWKNYAGKENTGKSSVINDVYVQTGIVNKNVSSQPFTSYASFSQTNAGSRLAVRLEQNNAPFPATDSDEMQVSKFVRDFAVIEYQKAVSIELKSEQKKLQVLEAKVADIDKAENTSLKNIGENTRSNEQSADAIQTNNSDIETSSKKINDQKQMVDQTASDKNANKGANKTLNGMESDKASMQKANEKSARKIEDRNENTREEERALAGNKEKRIALLKEIDQQKLVIEEVRTKLNNIQ